MYRVAGFLISVMFLTRFYCKMVCTAEYQYGKRRYMKGTKAFGKRMWNGRMVGDGESC